MQQRSIIDTLSSGRPPQQAQPKLHAQRRHRLPPSSFGTEKKLLHAFLISVFLVTMSMLIVPQGLESDTSTDLKNNLRDESMRVIHNEELKKAAMSSPKAIQQLPDGQIQKSSSSGAKPKVTTIRKASSTTSQTKNVQYHVVFSTGCSIFQDWQSYVFFFHLLKSGQEGHVTRIASGCRDKDVDDIRNVFQEQIAIMAPDRFHLHLTPDYSKLKRGINFKYFNKPFGMKHWMQEGLGYPDSHTKHDDTIIILMDPDQILLRPFTNDFSNSSEVWRSPAKVQTKVEHGSPFAQQYGYGLQWKDKINIRHVTSGEPSPLETMSRTEAFDYYMAMGPPYIATAKDMYAIVQKWTEFVPLIHDDYPHLLAEMFGYNVAAAHLGLRHSIAQSFMVSDIQAGGEGWKLIHNVEPKDICYNFPPAQLPHVIHYCQRYDTQGGSTESRLDFKNSSALFDPCPPFRYVFRRYLIGKWFIGKYRLRKDFISCESPLLTLPPDDVALKYDFAITPDGDRKNYNGYHAKDHAFMVCQMIPALNDAATYFKDHHCDKATANYEQSYVFHDNMDIEEENI
jgi:peptidyl serine alpha-galactosyltransferase